MIASFEPDNGFVDTYLGMDQITTDSYDGTKKHFYGNKYNTSAEILITLIKPDGADLSMADNRRVLRWLTGSRQASWLDFYVGDKLVYSFYGNITACQQYKLDARVIGIQATFTSIHPWAWSAPQRFDCQIGEKVMEVDNGALCKKYDNDEWFGIDASGVVYNSSENDSFSFSITDDGVVYNDSSVNLLIDNHSDDLYTLTNLDIEFENINSQSLVIKNLTLGEQETTIKNINPNEIISLNAGQFIFSQTSPNRIFGDDFSFVWPKLQPGINHIHIDGDNQGKGQVRFTYRYPIKIGDGAIDVEKLGRNPMCEGDISGIIGSIDGITTLARKNVMFIDSATNMSYSIFMKDGSLHVAEASGSNNKSITLVESNADTLYEITMKDSYVCLAEVDNPSDNTEIRDVILLIDETDNTPYEVTVKDNTPDDSADTNYSLYLSKI